MNTLACLSVYNFSIFENKVSSLFTNNIKNNVLIFFKTNSLVKKLNLVKAFKKSKLAKCNWMLCESSLVMSSLYSKYFSLEMDALKTLKDSLK